MEPSTAVKNAAQDFVTQLLEVLRSTGVSVPNNTAQFALVLVALERTLWAFAEAIAQQGGSQK